MNEDDFLLDDDEQFYYGPPDEEEEEDPDDKGFGDDDSDEDESDLQRSTYKGVLPESEIGLLEYYDRIRKCKEISDAVFNIVNANPIHNSSLTVSKVVMDMMHKQGHSRLRSTQYQQGPLFGDDVRGIDSDNIDDDEANAKFNEELTSETRKMIDAFINYLVNRDLSKDSVVSRRRKQRYLAAFIIYMFTVGAYEFIIDCPSMPEIYRRQISFALKKLTEAQYEVLEALASRYDELGRTKVAQRVREMGLTWFYKQPAEVYSAQSFKDLELTMDDIDVYREFRPKYTNVSTAITQEVISDYIEVVIDEKKGIFEKLKDKTRGDAIIDVKKAFRSWAEQYSPENTSLVNRLIYKD